MNHIENEILDIVVNVTKIDKEKLTREALFTDLGVESLDIVEIVFQIEEKYDIAIPFNANDKAGEIVGASFTTIGSVLDAVADLIEKEKAKKHSAAIA